MTPRDFVYWLNGFIEINKPESITDAQLEIIKEHLQKVVKYEQLNLNPSITLSRPMPLVDTRVTC